MNDHGRKQYCRLRRPLFPSPQSYEDTWQNNIPTTKTPFEQNQAQKIVYTKQLGQGNARPHTTNYIPRRLCRGLTGNTIKYTIDTRTTSHSKQHENILNPTF